MSNQAYDQKNSEDYEANTLIINNALLAISNNKKLKVTVAQLSKMTGIHRNTISNRVWPAQKLKQIKREREAEAQAHETQTRLKTNDVKDLLDENLNQARNEIIYWFNEYQDMKRFFGHSHKQYEKMRESRDYYKMLYEADRKSLLNAEQEIERLKELLELRGISSEQILH
ncbi:hypothetical protein H0920_01290 [Acinetobacter sp. C_4_1]|uniref:hypothetical protein n=1 Tax=unclassified Acinetobacter TaxID=196816 RepID=UPI0021B7AD39|nr:MULTISPECIES: hypothetical protein [unclassified Acinetobacter]MCT8088728.1 hypothetical protein [Acinetobacter sp. F_3_1]MCT8096884.1 hypothetical protein [Acinetobacter sp. C_3_1]MCT8099759.1 hypothetical protein [Acinetobacter sp. C_4_1]MCT8133727.1 hypothetical protein [Acinetobacter sp. T_3_1]